MKCGELFNKHFCKNQILLSPIAEISNLHFSHYKSMETINCHSNQSSYSTGKKNITFVEDNVLNKYAKFQLHLEKLHFMSPCQPIKSSDLDKSRMKHGGLLNKHFCKKKYQISPMTWQKLTISNFPIISLWKL